MAKHDGKGGLWANSYKQPGDKRPDYMGEITIHGITHKISGWINSNTGGGRPVINLVFSGEYKTPPPKPNAYAAAPDTAPREVGATTMTQAIDPFADGDKDIPF